MKEAYENASMEVISLDRQDIITNSCGNETPDVCLDF